ncbi:MAG: LysE family transporter [Bacteroidia bacterium]|nr:LysE family transporter [Bacteroidia bacterium]
MTEAFHFLLGLLISFIASIPVGPLNVAVVQATLLQGKRTGFEIALGGALIELLYCLFAIASLHFFAINQAFFHWLHLIAAILLAGLGFFHLRKKISEEDPKPRNGGMSLLFGISLGAINPMLVPFWLGVVAYLRSLEWLSDVFAIQLWFAAGIAVGALGLLVSVALIADRRKQGLSYKNKVLIQRILAWLFIALACIQFVSWSFSKLQW